MVGAVVAAQRLLLRSCVGQLDERTESLFVDIASSVERHASCACLMTLSGAGPIISPLSLGSATRF